MLQPSSMPCHYSQMPLNPASMLSTEAQMASDLDMRPEFDRPHHPAGAPVSDTNLQARENSDHCLLAPASEDFVLTYPQDIQPHWGLFDEPGTFLPGHEFNHQSTTSVPSCQASRGLSPFETIDTTHHWNNRPDCLLSDLIQGDNLSTSFLPQPTPSNKADDVPIDASIAPNVPSRNLGLPRRRSRYSLFQGPAKRPTPLVLPMDPGNGSHPLQRWRNSPPESEAADSAAILDALHNTPATRGNDRDTWTASNPSLPSYSSSSVTSAWSTKSDTTRSSQPGSLGRISKKRKGRNASGKDKARIFCCTFCCDTFRKKHDWTRHEQTLHLNCDRWVCAPYGGVVVSPTTMRSYCAYCHMLDPTLDHIEGHNHSACHDSQQPHFFNRKDHLVQHLKGFHQVDTLPVIDDWRIQQPSITSRCGFCDRRLESWQARADHLAYHFRRGKTMADWQGDHGFEPSIAAQVRNAIPPYLLSTESNTVIPFSATDPTVSDHLSQVIRRHKVVSASPAGQSVEDQEPSSPPPPPPPEVMDPGFEVTPSSYTKFLAWHLGRFAQQSIADGIVPTDDMFQDEARRLIYGDDDDNWEQTIVDNREWLKVFRNEYQV